MTDTDAIRVFAGDCTVEFEGSRSRLQRGRVVVVVKPDRTVLVHDADGYQPVAWLTRPDELTIERAPAEADTGDETDTEAGENRTGAAEGFGLVARAGDQTLRVTSNAVSGDATYPAGDAGVPVGDCPDCGGALVRTGDDVRCLDCDASYRLPSGATVLDETCPDCGLPTMGVERGARFDLCVDRACDPLVPAVRERFDREWRCPDCGSDLRIVTGRGGRLIAGCDDYPDCETAFGVPSGVVAGECACGLPVFGTARGRRCLDGTCERFAGDE
ncbi:topoisomerase DNA-binding C4 zinc finger domain-containing protein [Halobium salinum]|uniref:Topoisomerase DNA-binding C4 zinc finger domain-containing protein n=1 Tax=Halobium salinum TaxID=1364940 RepID=A0ABD5PG16_9EURY|nr:topoisomerase DNA-binding C4 zinc finger domain-containing protein [Halobium salinum]